MKLAGILVILAILVALGMSVYNVVAVAQLQKAIAAAAGKASAAAGQASAASDKASVSMNVAQNSKLRLGNLMGLEEFDDLDPEIKDMYEKYYVRRIMPALAKNLNAMWSSQTSARKQEVVRVASDAGDAMVREINREGAALFRQMQQEGMPSRAVVPAMVRATMKPMAKVFATNGRSK